MIISHHLWENAGDYVSNSEVFQDWKVAAEKMGNNSKSTPSSAKPFANLTGAYNVTVKKYDKDGELIDTLNYTLGGNEKKKTDTKAIEEAVNVTLEDTTKTNQTEAQNESAQEDKKPFYTHRLPLNALYYLLITPLLYLWQIQLERTFPGRLKAADIIAKQSHQRKSSSATSSLASLLKNQESSTFEDIGEDDSTREEAIVQKWIEQGKVKRQSLNWLNTLTKWILEMTVASICEVFLATAWEDLVVYGAWKKLWIFGGKGWIGWWVTLEVLLRYLWWSFTSLRPLATLVSFIVIPAHQRIVFVAGVDLVCATFLGLVVKAFLPWVEGTQFVKDLVGNMTETANSGGSEFSNIGRGPGGGGEL
ncbi:hypothetical protein CKM354_000636900 [Cercospora kikuchii]|uniref:Uncharacterized protein n=1 Tax=Cercospora kikuchii TaxID=84275 RepID=A0A9P3CHT4_9PEZI|nr:uncharacterized protein CKM354_000636900 [Cercospora kikuchii]GIZ43129.1 hypothetical protein CKM354_000636900 [Cercospora kikuchii]